MDIAITIEGERDTTRIADEDTDEDMAEIPNCSTLDELTNKSYAFEIIRGERGYHATESSEEEEKSSTVFDNDVYADDDTLEKTREDKKCHICLDLIDDEDGRRLHCNHVLHEDCHVKNCVYRHAHKLPQECPVCRSPLQQADIPQSIGIQTKGDFRPHQEMPALRPHQEIPMPALHHMNEDPNNVFGLRIIKMICFVMILVFWIILLSNWLM